MNTTTLKSEIINQEIQDLINYSKSCIVSKNELDPNLAHTLDVMSEKVEKAISLKKKSDDPISLIYLRLVKKVIRKFYRANELLRELNNRNRLFEEIDTVSELDILLENLKNIVSINPKELNLKDLQADIKRIEDLEDQKKRILMTYLMSDWKKLESVLLLMKLGETYRDIADELFNISILVN